MGSLTKQSSVLSPQCEVFLWIDFNDYAEDVCIVVEFSKKWEDISKNWGT
jgi:hypothetical protein